MPLFFGRNGHPGGARSPILKRGFPETRPFSQCWPLSWCQKNMKFSKYKSHLKHPMNRPRRHVFLGMCFVPKEKLHTANPCHILVAYVCDFAAIYVLKFLLVGFFGVGSALRFSSLGLFVRLGHLACIAAHPVTLRSGWGMRCLMAHDASTSQHTLPLTCP